MHAAVLVTRLQLDARDAQEEEALAQKTTKYEEYFDSFVFRRFCGNA